MEQIRISSATYRLKGNESLVEAFGTSNIYLKERGTQPVTIKNSSSTDLTVHPSGTETITGTATLLETGDYVTYSPVYGGYVVTDSGGVNTTETLANKTLTSPTITGNGTAVFAEINAVAATGVLSVSGVVVDGETVTIGEDVYEFCADTALSLTEGSTIPVNINAVSTKSTGTLTVATNPTAAQTLVIGPTGSETTYTFRALADFNAAGEILLGATAAATQAGIIGAIMGTDGANEPDPYVTIGAFATNAATVTAKVGGTVGDAINTTDNITNGFEAATLGSGADCLAPAAITALVAAVNTSGTEGVTATDGEGNTIDLVATAGAAGNALATTETMANGAFGHTTLVGGSDLGLASPLFTNPTHEITINTHSYASAHADWVLSAAEQLKPVHKCTLADSGANAIIPLSPSIPYTIINASGQAITVKGASGTGTAIANTKTATVMSDGTNVIRLTLDA